MKVKEAIEYCMSKKGAMETYPFDATTLVFKVGNEVTNKMFGLVYEMNGEVGLNLKCDPELSLVLRAQYKGVFPGYHMNKRHWNTILFDSDVPDDEILKFVDISYDIVFKSLTKKVKEEILI